MKMVPNPDYGDKMSVADWWDQVKCGCFNEYDGSGHYATDTEMDRDSDCFAQAPDWATHVMWFNK